LEELYYDRQGRPISQREWAEAYRQERHLGEDTIGPARVSTVWLGLDHRLGIGPPLIFETMVFGGPDDGEMERYSTPEQAALGHQRWVDRQKARTDHAGNE